MIIRLRVKTPPGHAASVERQLRVFILGKLKQPGTTYLSPEQDEFYWELDAPVKTYFRITRNAHLFQQLAGGVLDSMNKRAWLKKLSGITGTTVKGAKELIDETSVEIIKTATAEEIVEGNLTRWQKIKNSFHKEKN